MVIRVCSSVALLAVLLAGCGRAAAPPRAPEPSSGPEPAPASAPGYAAPPPAASPTESQFSSIEQAEAELARAAAELDGLALETEQQAAPASKAASRSQAADSASGSAAQEAASNQAGPANACELACRAISSMRRAAAAVCRLAGDESERCGRARTLLADNQRRVGSCHCGSD